MAALAAAVLAGCGEAAPPAPAQVGLAFGQELARIDALLAGVAKARGDRDHAGRLWGRAIATRSELRRQLDLTAPGGEPLRRAAEATIAAAERLLAADPATADLAVAATALGDAASALDPALPPSADGALARLERTR